MSIDSFGFQVMSLNELIESLEQVRSEDPAMGDRPVWVDNCPPLKWPVLLVAIPNDRTRGVALLVERGGN